MASLPRSARLLRSLVAATCLLPLVQACGRSEPGDYLYDSDGPITSGASASMAGRGAGTAGTRSSNGGATVVAGRGPGGAFGAGGTVAIGGGALGGGGPIPGGGHPGVGGTLAMGGVGVAGTGFVAGAGGAVQITTITCGDQTCNGSTESCCAGLAGLSCIGKNQACNGAVLGCTVNADCGGNGVCCISITGELDAASSCKDRCDMGTTRDRQLCQTDDECAMPFRYCTPTIFGVNICTRRG